MSVLLWNLAFQWQKRSLILFKTHLQFRFQRQILEPILSVLSELIHGNPAESQKQSSKTTKQGTTFRVWLPSLQLIPFRFSGIVPRLVWLTWSWLFGPGKQVIENHVVQIAVHSSRHPAMFKTWHNSGVANAILSIIFSNTCTFQKQKPEPGKWGKSEFGLPIKLLSFITCPAPRHQRPSKPILNAWRAWSWDGLKGVETWFLKLDFHLFFGCIMNPLRQSVYIFLPRSLLSCKEGCLVLWMRGEGLDQREDWDDKSHSRPWPICGNPFFCEPKARM